MRVLADNVAEERFTAATTAVERFRRWGGERLVQEMSAIFLGEMPLRIATARRALLAGDALALARSVHAMRSSCAQFGAIAMVRLCDSAEARSSRHDLADLPPLIDQLEAELADFGTYLASLAPTQ